MEKKLYDLTVNPRFARVTPPLREMEYAMLRDDILAHGCLSPLITWEGTIVDGHNRYRICRENAIPFDVEEMDFDNEDDAILWIIMNQLGRRNLNSFQRIEMVMFYETEVSEASRQRMLAGRKLPNGEHGHRTNEIMADMVGVSSTIYKQAKVIVRNADQETLRRLRNGEISINRAYNDLFRKGHAPKVNGKLLAIGDTVRDLISHVSLGEASPRMIIEELTRVATMIDEEARR